LDVLGQDELDLVFLDIKLPDRDGLALLADLRKANPHLPVLILTAHASLDTAIDALRLGARDYLLKPIDPLQILTRAGQILDEGEKPKHRRLLLNKLQHLISEMESSEPAPVAETLKGEAFPSTGGYPLVQAPPWSVPASHPDRYLKCGPFILDLHTRLANFNSRFIALTPTAFDYLFTLTRYSPDPVPYQALVSESQGYQVERLEAQEMARWRIHELRKAIEPDPRQPRYIITVRGFGYRLVP
jgi:DNA-binding response OmpR family regulator